ncbi:MAG: hypothetical protein ACRD68_02555 [Pyrinomonadaceae bacterium]
MKRWKKVALALLLLLTLSQAPFVYRRYRLGRLHRTIQELNSQRAAPAADDSYTDHRGVIHVHSKLGGHSTGNFEEIVAAAKANGLSFVVMTEHPAAYVDTAAATLRGVHEGVLFVGGSEINTAAEDRLLVAPGGRIGDAPAGSPDSGTGGFITRAKQDGRLVFVAYLEQFRGWEAGGFDGVEIYNLYTNTKKINYALMFFDGLWSYWSYPDLLFSNFYERPTENLKRWDELMLNGSRRLVAVAGNDAHQNVGLSLQHLTGERILQINLDPYERSFRVVRTHVLVERGQTLDTEALLSALGRGRCYIAFDLFGDSTGFRFTAENGIEKKTMGDETALVDGTRLRVSTPLKSRVVLFRDGQVIHEEKGITAKDWPVTQKGVYRVEVFLDQLPEPLSNQPWIISNPIYLR